MRRDSQIRITIIMVVAIYATMALAVVSVLVFSVLCIVRVPVEASTWLYYALLKDVMELAVGGMMVSFGAELAHLFITLMACFSRYRTANAMEKAIVSFCTRAEKEIDDEASSCKMIRDLNLDLTGKMKELVELEIENHKDMKTLRTKLNNLNIVSASESSSGSSTVSNGEITRESATTAGSDDEKKQTGDKSPTPSSGCSAASTSRVD